MSRPQPLLTVQQAAEEPTGFVYFARTRKAIKIGYAKDVAKRVTALQVGNVNKLKVVLTLPGTERDERQIHWLFEDHRMRGEWFRPDSFVLASIDLMREEGTFTAFLERMRKMNEEAEARKREPIHPLAGAMLYTVKQSMSADQ